MGRRPAALRLSIEKSLESGRWLRATVPTDKAKSVRNHAYQIAHTLGCGLETEIIAGDGESSVVRIRAVPKGRP
jgi:hypothetical protein